MSVFRHLSPTKVRDAVTISSPATLRGMEDQRRSRFVALYEGHVDAVMSYCLRHLVPTNAEDAVSDTFLVAWAKVR